MRLAWATDVHLNFVDDDGRREFLEEVAQQADALVVSGDIGESPDVGGILQEMAEFLQRPLYFVLGNHDFYRGSIVETRERITRLAADSDHLVYLTARGPVELTPETVLIGHDGWSDARLGDFETSDVLLNDYLLIAELREWTQNFEVGKTGLSQTLRRLGDEAANHLERSLDEAVQRYSKIIAVTHVPPFRDAAWHAGRPSDDNWLPHFSCKAAGDVFMKIMRAQAACDLLVVCGHTHGGGEFQPLENLRVLTGEAVYGSPRINRVFDV